MQCGCNRKYIGSGIVVHRARAGFVELTYKISSIPTIDNRHKRMFSRLDLYLILSPIIFTWVSFDFVCGLLIRPTYVYEGLIKSIHDYFNNTCILLLHNSNETGIMEDEHMLFLQKYLSMNSFIRTAFMDFRMFNERVGQSFFHIKRPLFVLMNDALRDDFAHEMASWIAMYYPTWLVFFGNETSISEFFFEIYVPFDCKFMVAQTSPNVTGREIITEVYQIDRGKELRSNQFGTWDVQHGLKGPKHGLYFRRNDLFGQNIRVTSIHDPPLSMFRRNAHDEIIGIDGFFGEVIFLLQEALNCTFTYKEAETWGMCLPNRSCTGVVEMLKNNDVDFAATEFMMTSDRLDAISFTQPIFTTKCRTYIKRPAMTDLKWNAYTAPFSGSIWGAIVFIIVFSSGLIVFIQKLFAFMLPYLQNDRSRFTEILFYTVGAFCSQGMKQSMLDPIRMVQVVIHLSAVVIVAAYSAALISYLAVKTFVMPFTTMDGLLRDNTYRFGVIKDSADYSFFQNTSDRTMRVLFDQLLKKETDLPNNALDGLGRVCREKKYAFMMMDSTAILLKPMISCKLESLDVITQSTIAMALQPNSPYRGIINKNILVLRDSGILQRLMQTQWSSSLNEINEKSGWKSVEIGDIVPLLLLIIITLFISYFICVVEQVIYKAMSNQRMKQQVNDPRQLDINMMLRRYKKFLTQK